MYRFKAMKGPWRRPLGVVQRRSCGCCWIREQLPITKEWKSLQSVAMEKSKIDSQCFGVAVLSYKIRRLSLKKYPPPFQWLAVVRLMHLKAVHLIAALFKQHRQTFYGD